MASMLSPAAAFVIARVLNERQKVVAIILEAFEKTDDPKDRVRRYAVSKVVGEKLKREWQTNADMAKLVTKSMRAHDWRLIRRGGAFYFKGVRERAKSDV